MKNSEAASALEDDKVRISMFDQIRWRGSYTQHVKVTGCKPHFSLAEFIAIDNERLIPQQSISTITNIDDIETMLIRLPPKAPRYSPRASLLLVLIIGILYGIEPLSFEIVSATEGSSAADFSVVLV